MIRPSVCYFCIGLLNLHTYTYYKLSLQPTAPGVRFLWIYRIQCTIVCCRRGVAEPPPQQVFGLLYISTQGALSLRSSSLLQLMLYTPPQSSDLLLLSLGIPQSNVQLLTLFLHIKVSNSEQPEGQWHRERIRRDGQVDGFLWILYKETCLFYLRNNESLNIRLLKMLQVNNASEFEGNTRSSWEDPRRLPNCDDNEFRFEAFNQMNNITGSPQNCATPEHWLGSPSDDLSRLGCSLVSAPLPCPCVFTFLCSDTVVGLKYFMQKLQWISDGLCLIRFQPQHGYDSVGFEMVAITQHYIHLSHYLFRRR